MTVKDSYLYSMFVLLSRSVYVFENMCFGPSILIRKLS